MDSSTQSHWIKIWTVCNFNGCYKIYKTCQNIILDGGFQKVDSVWMHSNQLSSYVSYRFFECELQKEITKKGKLGPLTRRITKKGEIFSFVKVWINFEIFLWSNMKCNYKFSLNFHFAFIERLISCQNTYTFCTTSVTNMDSTLNQITGNPIAC